MTVGQVVSGVTQIITANVTTVGTYNISIPANNGISWTGSNTFTVTGNNQPIILTASGTPTSAGTTTFALPTTPTCSFTRSVGQAFTSTVCSTVIGSFPATTTIGSSAVTITKTTSTDSGSIASVSNCGVSATGNIIGIGLGQSATFAFSVPLKNVQVFGVNNESSEGNEGYTVTASLAGVSVPIQLVPSAGTCQASFTSTQTGNTASINNTGLTSSSGLVFNISSNSEYDAVTITRSSATAGGNLFGFMLCNATAVPNITSGGSAVVSSYDCSGAINGTLIQGRNTAFFEPVTLTITALVATTGTYNLTTTANGVTFSGSGTVAAGPNVPIVLTATGTPVAAGNHTFTLNTTPSCSFNRTTYESYPTTNCNVTHSSGNYQTSNPTVFVNVTKASPNATGPFNTSSFQNCFLNTTNYPGGSASTLSGSQAATYTFDKILNNVQIYTTYNNNLGLPAAQVTEGLRVSATLGGNAVPVVLSPLLSDCTPEDFVSTIGNDATYVNKVVNITGGMLNVISTTGYDTLIVQRWNGVAADANLHGLRFCNATATVNSTSGGTAVISSFTCPGSSVGTLIPGVAASGVTQIISANVDAAGSYALSTNTVNGVTFTGSDTFSSTGNSQSITLTATGIPLASGTFTYTLNACSFTITVDCPKIQTGHFIDNAIGDNKAFTFTTLAKGKVIWFANENVWSSTNDISSYIAAASNFNGTYITNNSFISPTVPVNVYQNLSTIGEANVLAAGTQTINIVRNGGNNMLNNKLEYLFIPEPTGCSEGLTSGMFNAKSEQGNNINNTPAVNNHRYTISCPSAGKLILIPSLNLFTTINGNNLSYDIKVDGTIVENVLQRNSNPNNVWQELSGLAVASVPSGSVNVDLVPLPGFSGVTVPSMQWIHVPSTSNVTTGTSSATLVNNSPATNSHRFTLTAPAAGKYILLGQAGLLHNSSTTGIEYQVKNGATTLETVTLSGGHFNSLRNTLTYATELSVAAAGAVNIDYVPTVGKFQSMTDVKLLWIFIPN
ncbi:hypothetical protein FLB_14740 [Flavobacterium succinicans]|uniref:Uncharacterized protein n=2 Tax=Flavobacterium succinicans TaxID=29536 RepID=A0A199XSA2_9FLAO|nr:hypothetical protein FLB_14740 [Flavobacterium succinicans]